MQFKNNNADIDLLFIIHEVQLWQMVNQLDI